ncbi:MAG TPA: ABC transporter permease [Lachnospiraceae bacterium]|jgi:putative ABC transport system permease protein|nr:ABC transporter permease [Lachnospiraceae bacterium]
MTQFFEYIKMAFQNLRANKGRSLLTMLGIIIGISSVIMIISIGNGVKGSIDDTLNDFAGGQLFVHLDETKQKENMFELTADDFEAIETKIPHVIAVTPEYWVYGTAMGAKGEETDAILKGGNEGYRYILKEPIVKGSYFTAENVDAGDMVCVITESGARKMFGTTDNVIGMPIEVTLWGMTAELTVIGIRQDSSSAMLNMMTGADSSISVEAPYTIFNSFGFYIEGFDGAYIIGEGPEYSSDIYTATINLLEARYDARGEGYFLLQDFADSMSTITTALDAITIFVVFVASISLLVGGIGVMNIMLVSVTERTREIGIRKALGAKTNAIMTQFLSEAAIITLVGGLIGIILGVGGASGICSILTSLDVLECKAEITVATVLFASIFSSAVGIFFGIYPAKKAAKLSPIEALRHE